MTSYFDHLENVLPVLWRHAWQVTALVVAVAVVAGLLRHRHRHLVYVLWMVVLAKCLVPPVWSSSLSVFSWLGQEERIVQPAQTALYEFERMPAAVRKWSFSQTAGEPGVDGDRVGSPRARTGSDPALMADPAATSSPGLAWIPVVLWLCGAGLFAVWFVFRQVQIRRLVRRVCQPVMETQLLERLDNLLQRCAIRRRVRLLAGPSELGPATFGVFRPRIILPESLIDHGSPRDLELVLGHELIHVRRWDTLHALLQAVSQMFWWFHPLVWWGNRQIGRQRERCCDEEVVAALGCDPAEYAECLVNVLRSKRAAKALPGMAGLRPLEVTRQRLEMIMNFDARLHSRTPRACWLFVLILGLVLLPGAGLITATEKSEAKPAAERLDLIETTSAPHLAAASFVETSPDGRHVYVAAWQSGAVTVFSRDASTGELTEQQQVQTDDVAGVTDFRISSDGRIAIASCFEAKTAVLFERSPVSGRLHQLDVARSGDEGVSLYWPIDVAVSPDGRFAYIADDRRDGRGDVEAEKGDWGQILVLSISDEGRLSAVHSFAGEDRCLDGIRGLTCHPDGTTLFATGRTGGTLTVLNRDPATGQLSVRQVIKADDNDLSVLQGVMSSVCSPDGQFVYTASGRFTSDRRGYTSLAINAKGELIASTTQPDGPESPEGVGVFRLQSNGRLKLVQSIDVSRRPDVGLLGGNQLRVTRDGSRVYVSGTNNGTLISFLRDSSTGKLIVEQTLKHGDTGLAGLSGANGIAESPDGRFLYVTGEHANAINVLRRSGPRDPRPAASAVSTKPVQTGSSNRLFPGQIDLFNGKQAAELQKNDNEYFSRIFKAVPPKDDPFKRWRKQAAGVEEKNGVPAPGTVVIEPPRTTREAEVVFRSGRLELNGTEVTRDKLAQELGKLNATRLTITIDGAESQKVVRDIIAIGAEAKIKDVRVEFRDRDAGSGEQ